MEENGAERESRERGDRVRERKGSFMEENGREKESSEGGMEGKGGKGKLWTSIYSIL